MALARLRLVVAVFVDEVFFDFVVLVDSLLLLRVVARCCTAAILPILEGWKLKDAHCGHFRQNVL